MPGVLRALLHIFPTQNCHFLQKSPNLALKRNAKRPFWPQTYIFPMKNQHFWWKNATFSMGGLVLVFGWSWGGLGGLLGWSWVDEGSMKGRWRDQWRADEGSMKGSMKGRWRVDEGSMKGSMKGRWRIDEGINEGSMKGRQGLYQHVLKKFRTCWSVKQKINQAHHQSNQKTKKENKKTQRRNLILKIMQLPIDRPRRLLCYEKM